VVADPEQPRDSQDPTRLSEDDLGDRTTRAEDPAGSHGKGDPGPKRLGDFELLREIGRGGMGVVFEARQISLKRRVALKVLPPAVGLTQQARRRFEREAQAAAKLHHTNIVPVHAIGEDEGHHFYAMDLVEGHSLDHVLRQLVDEGSSALLAETVTRAASELPRQPGSSSESRPATTSGGDSLTSLGDTSTGSRPWFDAVAKLIAEVADALDYAHDRGVIHRDIKPANLMLSREGRLCITDFGLARIVREPGMTVSGSFLGTPAYMSPEQIAAGRVKLDHRTDVYSLGAVLYELLTLQRPFKGESREEVLSAIIAKDPRSPRKLNGKIPQDLETICLKALEKDPDRRYGTAGELAQDLRQYMHGGLIAARRAGPMRRIAKSIRRHPVVAVSTAAVILVLVRGGFAWRASTQHSAEAARRAVADARLAMGMGEYRAALASVDEALEQDSDLWEARLIRTRLLIELDRSEEAVREATAMHDERPDDWETHLVLAVLARGGWEPGRRTRKISPEEHVRFVESKAPETADAYYLRSLLADSPSEALALLDRAGELNPGHVGTLMQRARRYEELKDYPAAMAECDRLIAASPRSSHAHRLRSWIYRNGGDLLEAVEEMETAVELDREDPANYDHRARSYQRLGRHQARLRPGSGVGSADECTSETRQDRRTAGSDGRFRGRGRILDRS
jgi:serine/threonine protein kinase/Tfp pilus assembly protein PilF